MATEKKTKREITPADIRVALAKIGIDQVIGVFSKKGSETGTIICFGLTRPEANDYSIRILASLSDRD